MNRSYRAVLSMSSLPKAMERQNPSLLASSNSAAEDNTCTSSTVTSTRRRLHYMDFGRLEQFLQRRLNEVQERQNHQQEHQASPATMEVPNEAKYNHLASPLTTQSSRSAATARNWLQRANGARRRVARRLSSVLAGCLRGGERVEGELVDAGPEVAGLPMQPLKRIDESNERQRCNNATADELTSANARSSVLPTIEAVDLVPAAAEVSSAGAKSGTRRSARSSGRRSPRSCATTLTAVSASRLVSLPSSTTARTPTPTATRTSKSSATSRQRRHRHVQSDDTNDKTALLRSSGSEQPDANLDNDHQLVNFSAATNSVIDAVRVDRFLKRGAAGAVVGGAGGVITSGAGKTATVAKKDGFAGKIAPVGKGPAAGRGAKKVVAGQSRELGGGNTKLAKRPVKKSGKKSARSKNSGTTAGASSLNKLVTITSEGVAWSDELESLGNAPINELYRPGAVERRPAHRLPEDPVHDPPKSVALRRTIECPLVPLTTYKTDKKGELFYSVVQLCQTCRKDVCPRCRRSLCTFCTAIACSDCRMLLHQMVEIGKVDGGGGGGRRSLVRASQSQQRQQMQPYCHSCEKPVCLVCIDSLSMSLPTNERCVQHSISGNVYENICPWCGRTICRECRRSSCFACTKAFQCACRSSCQCDKNQPTIESASLEQLLANVDKLHTSGSEAEAYSQLCNALATGSAVYQCAEVFWRAARGARAMANATHDESARKALTYEAFEFAKQGLALEPQNSACHKWMGILLELTGRFEGTKKRIENSYLVRDHFQRAVEAKPDDAVVLHCLGAWCFEVADLPWYQRKLAAAFFATPPSSSYDEALKYLLRAEEVDPNFYSSNLLYIGKAYLRKGDRTNARTYLQRTVNYKGDTVDDKQSRDEAAQLLKSI
uniref:Regulator of microtubule dynamics protein 1 n=1 Tax=Macrostomum lignano TaxID=282301 RepID=A0A1I8IAZ5_9PLAT